MGCSVSHSKHRAASIILPVTWRPSSCVTHHRCSFKPTLPLRCIFKPSLSCCRPYTTPLLVTLETDAHRLHPLQCLTWGPLLSVSCISEWLVVDHHCAAKANSYSPSPNRSSHSSVNFGALPPSRPSTACIGLTFCQS